MEAFLGLLIYIVIAAICFWLLVLVLEAVGVAIPPRIKQLVGLLVLLFVVLWFVQGGMPVVFHR